MRRRRGCAAGRWRKSESMQLHACAVVLSIRAQGRRALFMGKSTGNGANIAWFFYAAMGRVGWGITLGAPGLNRGFPTQKWQKRRRDGVSGNFQIHLGPRQEPEVPAPPGINTKPCGCASSSALRADIARFFLCGHGPRGGDYVRGSAPKTLAGT